MRKKTDKVDVKTLAERLMALPGLGKVGSLGDPGRDQRDPPISQCNAGCQLKV